MIYKPHHTAISVRDVENSLSFYEGLGYMKVHEWAAEDKSCVIIQLKLGDSYLEIMWSPRNKYDDVHDDTYPRNLEGIGVKHIALQVDDLSKALQDLKEKGCANDATELKQGRTNIKYFFIKDPDGVWVEIVEDKRGY